MQVTRPGSAATRRRLRRPREWSVSAELYAKVTIVALASLVLIVWTGAAVRLTGSGLGCPDWPKCYGKVVAPLETHAVIEYGNRLLTGFVSGGGLRLGSHDRGPSTVGVGAAPWGTRPRIGRAGRHEAGPGSPDAWRVTHPGPVDPGGSRFRGGRWSRPRKTKSPFRPKTIVQFRALER